MTETEIWTEKHHRIEERLGIMFGDLKPTLIGQFMAEQEAEEWEREYRKENQLCK
jgi:hypothetical protein